MSSSVSEFDSMRNEIATIRGELSTLTRSLVEQSGRAREISLEQSATRIRSAIDRLDTLRKPFLKGKNGSKRIHLKSKRSLELSGSVAPQSTPMEVDDVNDAEHSITHSSRSILTDSNSNPNTNCRNLCDLISTLKIPDTMRITVLPYTVQFEGEEVAEMAAERDDAVLLLQCENTFSALLLCRGMHVDRCAVFAPDEEIDSLWRQSQYAVFRCMSREWEAAAADRDTRDGVALLDFLQWTFYYTTLFERTCSHCGRMLAFDVDVAAHVPPVQRNELGDPRHLHCSKSRV